MFTPSQELNASSVNTIHMHMHTHTRTCTCTHAHFTCTHTHAHTHTHTHIRTRTYTHAHAHTHTHMHTHTHAHTHAQQFCTALLQNLTTTNAPNSWSLATKALALTSLRILVREHDGIDEITCPEGLRPIVELAELSEDVKESCFASGDKVPASKVNG